MNPPDGMDRCSRYGFDHVKDRLLRYRVMAAFDVHKVTVSEGGSLVC